MEIIKNKEKWEETKREDKKHLRETIGELFLIIGGFIIAETIVRKFLELANQNIKWWILPLLAIALVSAGVQFKKSAKQNIYVIISWLWVFASVILVVLVRNNIINPEFFLGAILITSLVQLIFFIISLIKKKRKQK